MSRDKFYEICVQKNIVDTSAKILVLGAGIKDESIFKKLNFKNVTYKSSRQIPNTYTSAHPSSVFRWNLLPLKYQEVSKSPRLQNLY